MADWEPTDTDMQRATNALWGNWGSDPVAPPSDAHSAAWIVLSTIGPIVQQARQDGMNEALDWAASNPGYWAQKVAAHVVAQFEGGAE